jgi:hypothetical protein
MFYVRGHTKNACDRMFNRMKLRFHKHDIFTYKQELDALGNQDNVTMIDATEGMFKNYGALLDKYYNNFKTGSICQNHVFCMSNQDPDFNMKCATHDVAKFVLHPMLKRAAKLSDERRKEIQDYVLEMLKTRTVTHQTSRVVQKVPVICAWRVLGRNLPQANR